MFQPYKHHYGKVVTRAYMTGCYDFNKVHFLDAIHNVRLNVMKSTTIQSAWAKTGLIPYNPDIVLSKIQLPTPLPMTPDPQPQDTLDTTPHSGGALQWYAEEMNNLPDLVFSTGFLSVSASKFKTGACI
jgi:hypothetical protein